MPPADAAQPELPAMAEPFKNLINLDTVATAAQHLARACPHFDATAFRQQAGRGLMTLEFKARADHLARALEQTLPSDFAAACDAIERALAPVRGDESLAELQQLHSGLTGWVAWPLGEFVARRGLEHPERALDALHALTQRHTAEWAIRPFLEHHQKLTFARLAKWCRDPSAHVRRLVSEGSRPRLPWGTRLRALMRDPSPTLPLLARLQDDPSEYVRRSVANHLNDIGKDHPALLAQWLEQNLPDASAERQALLRHATRSLIKAGDKRVLTAWGLGRAFAGEARLRVAPRRIALGEFVTLELELCSRARRAQTLLVDYAVHHVKADGKTSAKVFKGVAITLAAGATFTWSKRHPVRPITTRVYYPGKHRVDVRINGEVCAEAAFELRIDRQQAGR